MTLYHFALSRPSTHCAALNGRLFRDVADEPELQLIRLVCPITLGVSPCYTKRRSFSDAGFCGECPTKNPGYQDLLLGTLIRRIPHLRAPRCN